MGIQSPAERSTDSSVHSRQRYGRRGVEWMEGKVVSTKIKWLVIIEEVDRPS